MNRYLSGLLAGLAATLVISIVIIAKATLRFEPQLELVGMPSQTLGVGIEAAWAMHVVIGAIWGLLFALVGALLPGRHWSVRGLAFGGLAWLLMMVAIMPMAGAGLFGLNFGFISPATTLALHLIFGLTMGAAYGWLIKPHHRGRFVFH
jgi:hypothetical protein